MSANDFKTDEFSLPERPSIKAVLDALKDPDNATNSVIYYGLSSITPAELEQLKPVWLELAPQRRRSLMRQIVEIGESDFEMDYESIGRFALSDDDPGVREAAIEALWESESLDVMQRLMLMAKNDPVDAVRARAVTGLGQFILLGELDDLSPESTLPARHVALELLQDTNQPIPVRRRALEALANCSHERVPSAIREAYYGDNHEMRVSSLFAMGRTCDPQWRDIVLEELDSSDEEMRYEAARASGELELKTAIPHLARLAAETDVEIRDIAIWSLGEIGGSEAMRVLNLIAESAEEADDDLLMEVVEEAIGNASLFGGDLPLMIDLDEDDLDDTDRAE